MTEPVEPDPTSIPPLIGDPGRRLSDKEYDATYASGDGGHPVPPEVGQHLEGWDDPEAVPPSD